VVQARNIDSLVSSMGVSSLQLANWTRHTSFERPISQSRQTERQPRASLAHGWTLKAVLDSPQPWSKAEFSSGAIPHIQVFNLPRLSRSSKAHSLTVCRKASRRALKYEERNLSRDSGLWLITAKQTPKTPDERSNYTGSNNPMDVRVGHQDHHISGADDSISVIA
jgi:hypothetical protein